MNNEDANQQLELYKSLFRGREDIFAIRWEKEGKSGYSPAYDLDWIAFRQHKAMGGTIANFNKKAFLPLKDAAIRKHLIGQQFIGIYPLMADNTSWFLAVDFDEKDWLSDCLAFIAACQKEEIPCYLERSRSGNGGHIWIFFEEPYPAFKSRRIAFYLLAASGATASKQKTGSFDRIFPNQDAHSGKAFGNLIALPLHKRSLEKGNNCFLDQQTLQPFADQWKFLSRIQRVGITALDATHYKISAEKNIPLPIDEALNGNAKLTVTLSNQITIEKHRTPAILLAYLKEQLSFRNSEYWSKKTQGRNTWDTPAKLDYQQETETHYILPRGMIGNVLRFCREKTISFEFLDQRRRQEEVEFKANINLRTHQQVALEVSRKKDFGIIVASPGTGKTVMALAIVAEKKQPALIIVHRRQLLDQWVERIQEFLGIPKHEIGVLGNNQNRKGKAITIALIQTLAVKPDADFSKYGIVIVDECHHIPAESFNTVISQFNSYYFYGLTATPFRKHSDEKALFLYLGDIIAEVVAPLPQTSSLPSVIIRNTTFDIPYDSTTDQFESLSKILIHDTERNALILQDVEREVTSGRKCVVLTERKEHIMTLLLYLKKKYEVVILNSEDTDKERTLKWAKVHAKEFEVIVTTGQLFGEGTDLQSIESLLLVYPFAYEGKLIQYMGRVMRAEVAPAIYDYRDERISVLEKLFQKRNAYYCKLYKKGELKLQQEVILRFRSEHVYIQDSVSALPFEVVELPDIVRELKPDTNWLIRVLKMEATAGLLFAEILDYQHAAPVPDTPELLDYVFISKIRFRAIDTAKLLLVANLKKPSSPGLSKSETPTFSIEKVVKLSFEALEFRYGAISFELQLDEHDSVLNFEIENEYMRPEFEVLKPYFSKVLKTKKVAIQVKLEMYGAKVLRQEAGCIELERINQEVIDSLKFQFSSQHLFKRKSINGKALLTLLELEENEYRHSVFQSEEELLHQALLLKNVKHGRQLRFLAQKHESGILKIRFILEPSSFVFLLTGKQHYHLIWETLNTEEATYIWQVPKENAVFVLEIERIEREIQEVKHKGRQKYIETERAGFARILHDYQNEKKGFVRWRDALELLLKLLIFTNKL